MSLNDLRESVDGMMSEYQAARDRQRIERQAVRTATRHGDDLKAAHAIAAAVAAEVQRTAHRRIADIVSRSLIAVFDEPYEFKINFEQKRGKTEARLTFVRDGSEIDPMEASGGGVVDVAAFALRLSCLLLSKPALRRLLVLDEPFRFVSAEYRPRVRALVESLASELDCQFLIVTHQDEFRIGDVIEL